MLAGKKGPYVLLLHNDEDAISPREDDCFGTMVCFHRRYNLGDEHDFTDKDDFLRELYLDTVGRDERGEQRYGNLLERFDSTEYGGYGFVQYQRAVDNALLEAISEKNVILPLYLYDHSGITMNTTGFTCPWDSGQVGWIYATRDAVLKEYGGKNLTAAKREKAENLLCGEVAHYDCYLRGECYGFELLKNGKTVDSCWGFIGETQEVLEAVREYLPDECKVITEHMSYREDRASVLDFLKEARSRIADGTISPKREAIETAR